MPENTDIPAAESAPSLGYAHPTTISEFEAIYRKEYARELESSDHWIKWGKEHADGYAVNFHEGMQAALIFNNIKMEQLLRVLKQEPPNAKPESVVDRSGWGTCGTCSGEGYVMRSMYGGCLEGPVPCHQCHGDGVAPAAGYGAVKAPEHNKD